MSENEVLDDAVVQSSKKTATNSITYFLKRYKWWIIGVVIAIIAIAVIIYFCVRKPTETFVSFNPSDAKHRKIDTTPVTTYLESYINSALGGDNGSVNPYTNPYKK